MWRLGPDGYGSISSWYQWSVVVGAPGTGLGTWNAPSSSQTRCHFCSMSCGSYLGVLSKRRLLERKNLSEGEVHGRPTRRCRACLPGLAKKQLLHSRECSNARKM